MIAFSRPTKALGSDSAPADDETVELVMVVFLAVLVLDLVMRLAVGDIGLGRTCQPEQHIGRQRSPLAAVITSTVRAIWPATSLPDARSIASSSSRSALLSTIMSADDQLVLEQFLERVFMVERRILRALVAIPS